MRSIAEIAWGIVEKRENERVEHIKNLITSKMQEHFDKLTTQLSPWQMIYQGDDESGKGYVFDKSFFDNLESEDVIVYGGVLGFRIIKEEYGEHHYQYYISILQWTEGTEKTIAQKMLDNSNIKINRKIKKMKELEEQAKEACNEIFEKIKKEDFSSIKKDERYKIDVEMKCLKDYKSDDCKRIFKEKAREILEKEMFEDVYFQPIKGMCELWISDPQEKK